MKSQTAQRPENKRPIRSAKGKKYTRQTAHVEARRDGKPLIFGWGAHLSRSEKTKLQRRAIWILTALISVSILAVLVISWVNINITTPNLPIASVNGQNIPQVDYHKFVVVKGQLELNKLKGPNGLVTQNDKLGKQVADQQTAIDKTKQDIDGINKKLKDASADQKASLKTQLDDTNKKLAEQQKQLGELNTKYTTSQTSIQLAQSLYTQSQIGTDSVSWLQDDLLIRNWESKQNATVRGKIDPNSAAVEREVQNFKASLPKGTDYAKFLSSNNINDTDLHNGLTLKLRRDNMQSYLASQVTTPAYQTLASAMTLQTQKDAEAVLKQLKSGGDFAKLAKEKSVDNGTKEKGGDLGWLAHGQYFANYASKLSAVIDNWISDPKRTLGELSPVLTENGTYHIVLIRNVDPSREISKDDVKTLQDNALSLWSYQQKALPGAKVSQPDADKLLDPSNMPPWIPSSPPGQQQQGGGLPGGQSGGVAPAGS